MNLMTVAQLVKDYDDGKAPVYEWVKLHAQRGAALLGLPEDEVVWLTPDFTPANPWPHDDWRANSTEKERHRYLMADVVVTFAVYAHNTEGFKWVAAYDWQEGGSASIFVAKKYVPAQ